MSLRWSLYVAPKLPKGGSKTQSVRYKIGYQLLLITNRKLHMGFRLIPSLMTLNDLERRNSPYFAFFTKFDSFAGQLRHSGWRQTYNVRKILSPSYSLPLFWPKLTHPAVRSLCDSWAICLASFSTLNFSFYSVLAVVNKLQFLFILLIN